jgi:hypothetical protein
MRTHCHLITQDAANARPEIEYRASGKRAKANFAIYSSNFLLRCSKDMNPSHHDCNRAMRHRAKYVARSTIHDCRRKDTADPSSSWNDPVMSSLTRSGDPGQGGLGFLGDELWGSLLSVGLAVTKCFYF